MPTPQINNQSSNTLLFSNKYLSNYRFQSELTSNNRHSITPYLSNYRFYKSISDLSIDYLTNNSINQSTTLLINDVQHSSTIVNSVCIDITTVSDDITIDYIPNINDTLPLFFINKDLIKVPSKIERTLRRHTPNKLLLEIHSNIDVAIEMCLIFTTQLTSTYFTMKDGSNPDGWKSLHATYLRELISVNPDAYKNVINALLCPLEKGAIIERDKNYIVGSKNRSYRLGKSFVGKGIQSYILKTKEAKNSLNRHYFRTLSNSYHNAICQNLITVYANIVLPTIDEIILEAKRLINLDGGYKTKKGKKLRFLHKKKKSYYKDADSCSFVEDSIEIFEYLTSNGLMIPIEGSERSGGRVVDSFTLMPSWIRNLVTYKGERLVECDFSCLHPNIAIGLYGGSTEYLTHNELAMELDMDLLDVKVEHLSFFNKTIWQMKQSPLYNYYEQKEPFMLDNIIHEKLHNNIPKKVGKHKMTSRRLFKKEVDIMTQVIKELDAIGINVLYVYDALLSHPNDAKVVAETMNRVVLLHGVKTRAKAN